MNHRRIIAAFAAGIALGGCSQNSVLGSDDSGQRALDPGAIELGAPTPFRQLIGDKVSSRAAIYVGNFGSPPSVTIYNTGKNKLIGTISKGLNVPYPFVSPTGELYVANYEAKSVTVYSTKTHKLVRTLTREIRFPSQVIFDAGGDAYVRTRDKIVFFPKGRERGLHSLKVKSFAIALDTQDDLYVASATSQEVEIFKPGARTPFKVISDEIDDPFDIALDATGRLYVANYADETCGSITVYTPQGKLAYTITQGICNPYLLGLGNDGTIYVLNSQPEYSVTEYAPSNSTPLLTITNGVDSPRGLAIDENNNLYVADSSSVTVYGPGSDSMLRTITDGISHPTGIAFGR